MPSTATITSFYTFTAGTKARAAQVNGNFDIFRGHIVPIDPNTQTSINNTYDLGSTEYRWRTGYFDSVNRGEDQGTITSASGKCARSGFGASAIFGNTTTATPIIGTTLTVTCTGRPLQFRINPSMPNGSQVAELALSATTTAGTVGYFSLMRDAVTMGSMNFYAPAGSSVYLPVSTVCFTLFCTAGTYVFHLRQKNTGFANAFNCSQSEFICIEL
jgi:hypothetical protein